MLFDLPSYTFIFGLIIASAITLAIIVRELKGKRHAARMPLVSAFILIIGAILYLIGQSGIINEYNDWFTFGDFLCFAVSAVFIYIFLKHISSPQVESLPLFLRVFLLAPSLFLLFFFALNPQYQESLLMQYYLSQLLFYIGILSIYGGVGFSICYKWMKEVHTWGIWVLTSAIISVSIGLILLIIDAFALTFGFAVDSDLVFVRFVSAIFQGVGIGLFAVMFLFDEKYLFKFPFDVYFLVLFYKHSGVPVEFIQFKTKKEIDIDEAWLSGFFSSLNKIFQNMGKLDRNIESVSGGGLHFFLEWGTKIGCLVVGDQISYYLEKALKQFSKDFEEIFTDVIQTGSISTEDFAKTKQLITKNFPFFQIQE